MSGSPDGGRSTSWWRSAGPRPHRPRVGPRPWGHRCWMRHVPVWGCGDVGLSRGLPTVQGRAGGQQSPSRGFLGTPRQGRTHERAPRPALGRAEPRFGVGSLPAPWDRWTDRAHADFLQKWPKRVAGVAAFQSFN